MFIHQTLNCVFASAYACQEQLLLQYLGVSQYLTPMVLNFQFYTFQDLFQTVCASLNSTSCTLVHQHLQLSQQLLPFSLKFYCWYSTKDGCYGLSPWFNPFIFLLMCFFAIDYTKCQTSYLCMMPMCLSINKLIDICLFVAMQLILTLQCSKYFTLLSKHFSPWSLKSLPH